MSRATAMTPEERRQAIVDAVQPLLLAQGTELSTRQLAQAAGVAEGTLFRVFESKQELIEAAVLAALKAEPAIEQLGQLPDGVPLEQRVSAIVAVLGAELGRTRALTLTLHAHRGPAPSGTSGHHRAFHHNERRQRLLEAVTRALDPYADKLALPAPAAARLILAFSFATSLDTADSSFPEAADVADVVLHGIARGTR